MVVHLAALITLLLSIIVLGIRCAHARRPVSVSRLRERIRLRLDAPGGFWQVVDLEPREFSCGFSQKDDIDLRHFLPAPKRGPRRRVLRFSLEGDTLRAEADAPLILNGVRRSHGVLRPHQFLRLAGLKLSYVGLVREQERLERPRSKGERLIILTPGILLFCCGLILTLLGFSAPGRAALPVVRAPKAALEKPGASKPERKRTPPVLIPPGGDLPDVEVDILFVHAHPDDESLDFGTLLAAADAAGLRTAVLLLTDGEGGIFRSDYQGPRGRLADLRVAEAVRAMTALGVDYYIRFGLQNLPYNGTADERSPRAVLEGWAEAEALPERLTRVIGKFRPAVLVSPDGPSAAREHFEHEAAGLAVLAALESLEQSAASRPAAHLVCIDPRQADLYPEKIAFPRGDFVPQQKEALLAHATQADASLFGVEMIAEQGYEYYHVKQWRLDEDPAIYLLPGGG